MKRGSADVASRPVTLRRRLLAIAVAGMLPLAIVSGLGLVGITVEQQRQAEQQALEVTRLLAMAIEMELGRSFDVLHALAQSPLLDGDDLVAFERLVARVLPAAPGWDAVNIATPRGEVISRVPHLSAPFDASRALTEARSFSALLRIGEPQVGYLGQTPDGNWGIPLRVPVSRDGRLKYALNAVVRPDMVRQIISRHERPAGWIITVLDASGRRLARSERHGETFGESVPPQLTELLETNPAHEGIDLIDTAEAGPIYTAFVRLDSGWTIVSGIPSHAVDAGARRAVVVYGGGLLLSLALALLAALVAARRINRPMRELHAAVQAIGRGAVPTPPRSEIVEIQEVGDALGDAARARHQSERERTELVERLERVREALTQQVADLEQLQQLNQRLLELATLDAQLEAILVAFCDFHEADHGVVLLRDDDGARTVATARGFDAASLDELRQLVAAHEAPALTATKRRLVIADLEQARFPAPLGSLLRRERLRAVHSTPMRSSDGRVLGTLTVQFRAARSPSARELRLADLCAGLAAVIIERAEARAAAGASAQRLHVALDSSTIPFCVLTPLYLGDGAPDDFRCDFANQTAAVILRRPLERLIGMRLADVLRGRFPTALATLADAIASGTAREREIQGEGAASGVWYHLVVTPFEQSVAVWFNDISARKRQEQALQEADRRKDAFIATLAHELRNPLAPIRQAAAIIGSAGASDTQKQRSSAVIERQVSHMVLLLDDLLDVSRITLGKLSLRQRQVDLIEVIEAGLESVRPALIERHHTLTTNLPPAPLMVEGDPLRLEQILVNLLTNAAKYTGPTGLIELIVTCHGERVEIAVRDNGIGIEPEEMNQIFQMFSQLQEGPGSSAGLGIGLALARGLAQLHGGDIHATSAGHGKGSTFTVELPIGVPMSLTPTASAGPAVVAGGQRRVLIADDNRDIAETLAELFELEGHAVELAFSGPEALERYRSFQPDIALLDIGMPGMRGDEVARAIRELPDGAQVTLVAITGWGQERDKAITASAGFDQHLTKPVDIATLLDIVAMAPVRVGASPPAGSPSPSRQPTSSSETL